MNRKARRLNQKEVRKITKMAEPTREDVQKDLTECEAEAFRLSERIDGLMQMRAGLQQQIHGLRQWIAQDDQKKQDEALKEQVEAAVADLRVVPEDEAQDESPTMDSIAEAITDATEVAE